MVSKILVIADATLEGVEQALEALKTIHSDRLYIMALFVSRLFGASLKNLGPNILTLMMRGEEDALQRARVYFMINDIPYDIRIMSGSDWQAVSREIEAQEHDVLIIQGEFANIWGKDHPSNYELGTITGSANPVWIIKGPDESPAVPVRLNT